MQTQPQSRTKFINIDFFLGEIFKSPSTQILAFAILVIFIYNYQTTVFLNPEETRDGSGHGPHHTAPRKRVEAGEVKTVSRSDLVKLLGQHLADVRQTGSVNGVETEWIRGGDDESENNDKLEKFKADFQENFEVAETTEKPVVMKTTKKPEIVFTSSTEAIKTEAMDFDDCIEVSNIKTLHENRTIIDNQTEIATIDEIEGKYHSGFKEGYWRPSYCKPRSNLAVMIAYRNRERNMKIMLPYLIELLQKQLQHEIENQFAIDPLPVSFFKLCLFCTFSDFFGLFRFILNDSP